MGIGEIARHEQFLLFPQCFQKACFPGASKCVIVWEWVKYRIYRRGGLEVRASALWAVGRGFEPRLRQTKVFENGSSGFLS